MKTMGCSLILVGVMVVVLSGTVLADVQISWSDAGGAKSVPLQMVNVTGGPLYAGFEWAWIGTLDVQMDSAPIDFTASGDYIGEYNEPWFQVILYQNVTNLTECSWSEFNLDLDGAFFGQVDGAVNNWNVDQSQFNILYYADPESELVDPGDIFHDGITVFDPQGSPTADFVITKYPTCIPEPGTLAVLLGGMVGLVPFIKRRRA